MELTPLLAEVEAELELQETSAIAVTAAAATTLANRNDLFMDSSFLDVA
jgi:hypothetical protein